MIQMVYVVHMVDMVHILLWILSKILPTYPQKRVIAKKKHEKTPAECSQSAKWFIKELKWFKYRRKFKSWPIAARNIEERQKSFMFRPVK